MGEWKECKLGDIATYVNRGITPKYIDNGGIPIINQKCIRNGQISNEFLKYQNEGKKHLPEKKLIVGDILINSTGVGTAGRVGLFLLNHYTLADSHVSILRLNENEAEPQYVFYNLRNREDELENTAEGSTGQIELKRDGIKDLDILLPPLPEQKAIASVLSSLDDKIDLLHCQNKILEAMTETLFGQWFADCDYSCKVSDLIEIQNGYAFKSKDFKDVGVNGVIKIKNISENIVDIYHCDFIEELVANQTDSRFVIKTGDILFAMTGAEIGKMGIVLQTERKLWLNQRVGLLKEKYNGSRFLAYLQLKSDYGQDYIDNTATGSAQPNISGIGIENCEFPKITANQIKKYSEKLLCLYEKIIFNLCQIRTLEKLRDTLLPKLMSGEVRVQYDKEATL